MMPRLVGSLVFGDRGLVRLFIVPAIVMLLVFGGGIYPVSAGNSNCGVTSAGEAHCWGGNGRGQLGDGTTIDKNVPVRVSGGLSFMSLSAGSNYVCGVTTTGEAYCWGNNSDGQLGDGTTTTRLTPVRVVQ